MQVADIQGWFNYAWVYDWAARHVGSENWCPTFVEVGVWKGASIAYLCDRLLKVRQGRPFRLCAVDTWAMTHYGEDNKALNKHIDDLLSSGHTLYDEYDANIRALGLRTFIDDFRCDSVEAAMRIERADFVFIDGDHSTDAVCADLAAWRPRARVLAGHDGNQLSVHRALARTFGDGGFCVLPMLGVWTTCRTLAQAWEREHERIVMGIVEDALNLIHEPKGPMA
jgi:hypothetical protein